MNYRNISPFNCIFIGFGYFFSRPYLWIGPLFSTLLSFFFLCTAFFITTYLNWPNISTQWFPYALGILKSFGYASLVVIILWVSVFPIILNIAFENMIGKVLHDHQRSIQGQGIMSATISSCQLMFQTLGWRVFWPVATFFSLFIFSPLSIFLAQMGIGHIAFIDALDLSLSIQGISGKKRIFEIKKRSISIFAAGLLAGFMSMILTTTVIGWFFFLPSVYIGSTLWTLNWIKAQT